MKIKLGELAQFMRHFGIVADHAFTAFGPRHEAKKISESAGKQLETFRACVSRVRELCHNSGDATIKAACPEQGFIPSILLDVVRKSSLADGSASKQNIIEAIEQLEKDIGTEIEIDGVINVKDIDQLDTVRERLEAVLSGSMRSNKEEAALSDAEWRTRAIAIAGECAGFVAQLCRINGKTIEDHLNNKE